MPKNRPMFCKRCGERPKNPLHVSYNGICRPCGELAEAENARQLEACEGPYYEAWRAGLKRAAQRI